MNSCVCNFHTNTIIIKFKKKKYLDITIDLIDDRVKTLNSTIMSNGAFNGQIKLIGNANMFE